MLRRILHKFGLEFTLTTNHTLPRTLGILWILMENRNDENEDIEDHDEDKESINVELDKEGTYY